MHVDDWKWQQCEVRIGDGEMGLIGMNFRKDRIRNRIERLVKSKGVELSAVAADAGVETGTVQALYDNRSSEVTMTVQEVKRLSDALDRLETRNGLVFRCADCGEVKPMGRFYMHKKAKNGIDTTCIECRKKKGGKKKDMKKGTMQGTVTADIVRRVKSEDKREVESKFMAPYFGIQPAQLDDIRRGKYDNLMFAPKSNQQDAINALRDELHEMRAENQRLNMRLDSFFKQLGCDA